MDNGGDEVEAYQAVFKRYEEKYLLEHSKWLEFMEQSREYLKENRYGKSQICNIYFDTPDFRLIRESLDKPSYKEKLRLRSYSIPSGDSVVFVELKKKFDGVVYKRRESMRLEDAETWLYDQEFCHQDSQIFREIDWFLQYYGSIVPSMYISYDRLAFDVAGSPGVRITFDTNLYFRTEDLWLEHGRNGTAILRPDQHLMEIKTPGAFPLWLCRLLSRLEIYPASFSKYGTAYRMVNQ